VTSAAGSIDCPDTCWDRFDTGTRVILKAAAAQGYKFTGWSSLLARCGTGKTCVVRMNTTTDVTAKFVALKR
jgi:hypothetical protein